jgi:hypothetical protein
MQPILLGEYRNQNSRRKYPFADDMSLLDKEKVALPIDFIVDAYMYPINLMQLHNRDLLWQSGDIFGLRIYMSKIDLGAGNIYFNGVESGELYGVAEFTQGDLTANIYEAAGYHRQIGILVFGDGMSQIYQGLTVREFLPWNTQLCPAVFAELKQVGLRGFVLEDGTLITGGVIFEGQDGITIKSYIDGDGKQVLKFDVPGVVPPSSACDNPCGLIKTLCFQRRPGSSFMICQYQDNSLSLSSYGFTLDDICAAQKSKNLPDKDGNLPNKPKTGDDPCGPAPIPPGPVPPGPCIEVCYDMEDLGGNFYIVTPSAPGYSNAVGVKEMDQDSAQALARINIREPVTSYQDVSRITNQVANPPFLAGGIVIYFKGMNQYKK